MSANFRQSKAKRFANQLVSYAINAINKLQWTFWKKENNGAKNSDTSMMKRLLGVITCD